MEEEIWKPIKDFEGYYEVSNIGRVKSLNYRGTGKEKLLKNIEDYKGYLTVTLTKNGKQKVFYIHRLVAVTFIPNPEGKPCIDHINTIRNDNRIENLRWVTYEENNNNQLTRKKMSETVKGENNPMYGRTGEKHPKSKSVVQIDPTTNEVVKVWESTREAERIGGFCHSSIGKCCKNRFNRLGNNIYKGFRWMYLEDYEKLN